MSSAKVMLGVVAGAAAGAILGLLLAPGKGSTTRKRIVRTGSDYAEDAKDKFNEYIDTVTKEIDTVKEDAKDWVDRGKEKAASLAGVKRGR